MLLKIDELTVEIVHWESIMFYCTGPWQIFIFAQRAINNANIFFRKKWPI